MLCNIECITYLLWSTSDLHSGFKTTSKKKSYQIWLQNYMIKIMCTLAQETTFLVYIWIEVFPFSDPLLPKLQYLLIVHLVIPTKDACIALIFILRRSYDVLHTYSAVSYLVSVFKNRSFSSYFILWSVLCTG